MTSQIEVQTSTDLFPLLEIIHTILDKQSLPHPLFALKYDHGLFERDEIFPHEIVQFQADAVGLFQPILNSIEDVQSGLDISADLGVVDGLVGVLGENMNLCDMLFSQLVFYPIFHLCKSILNFGALEYLGIEDFSQNFTQRVVHCLFMPHRRDFLPMLFFEMLLDLLGDRL